MECDLKVNRGALDGITANGYNIYTGPDLTSTYLMGIITLLELTNWTLGIKNVDIAGFSLWIWCCVGGQSTNDIAGWEYQWSVTACKNYIIIIIPDKILSKVFISRCISSFASGTFSGWKQIWNGRNKVSFFTGNRNCKNV